MRIKQIILGLAASIAFTLSTSEAFAQGSPYNLLGFGEPVLTRHARIEGLGGTGVGLAEGRIINDMNPAAWSWLTRARLETSFRFDRTSTEFGNATAVGNDFRFNGLNFGSTIWNDYKASIALGFAPLTNASHELAQTDTFGTRKYFSEGGVSLGYIGGSIMPTPGVAIGARLDLLFGNVRHLSSLGFAEGQSGAESQFQRDYSINGLRGTFGLMLHGDSLINALDGLTLGVAFSTGSSLTVKRRTTSLVALNDTTIEAEAEGFYPGSLAAGISYNFARRYRVLADYHMQDFSQAVLYADDASVGDPNLRAMSRISVGFERLPNQNNEFGAGGAFSKLGVRLGAFFNTTPFAPMADGVQEIGGSFGLGIPITSESILDVALTVGQRGPSDAATGPSDIFMRVGASIGLAERWFVPTRRNDD